MVEKIYITRSGLIDFVAIEEDLFQLHQYVKKMLKFTSIEYSKAEAQYKESKTAEELDYFGDEKYRWENNTHFLCPAMSLVSLYMLVEKSLKNLCYSFSENSTSWYVEKGVRFKVPKSNKESNIDASLKYLLNTKKFKFTIPQDLEDILERIRVLRNDFAHGDWENVEKTIKRIDVDKCFEAVSDLFFSIEDGMEETAS